MEIDRTWALSIIGALAVGYFINLTTPGLSQLIKAAAHGRRSFWSAWCALEVGLAETAIANPTAMLARQVFYATVAIVSFQGVGITAVLVLLEAGESTNDIGNAVVVVSGSLLTLASARAVNRAMVLLRDPEAHLQRWELRLAKAEADALSHRR